jgi:prepilin-type N-terminal cleavage/methylation domain-containing protein
MKKAFTLIELLVVIAIIAILAAILFPVFAQAKDAAKNTGLLSNTKQTGTGLQIYLSDYDDTLPLSWQNDTSGQGDWSWQGNLQPYLKNWQILVNPKLSGPTGAQAYWQRMQYFGSLPVAGASTGAAAINPSYYQNINLGSILVNARAQGLMGAGLDAGQSFYGYQTAPSRSSTSIANVSNTILVSESGSWDYLVGVYGANTPFTFCSTNGTWGSGWSPHAGKNVYAGPSATTRPKSANESGIAGGCYVPAGRTTAVMVDSSARSMDYRGQVLKTENVGGVNYMTYFWPDGI